MQMITMLFLSCFLFVSSADAEYTINTFSTRSYKKEYATGLIHQPVDSLFEMSVPRKETNTSAALPARYSLRGKAGPVENQGHCGSCWDFSLTSVLRGTLMMNGEDPGRLSFNYLLNCNRQMSGCNGGTFSAASYLTDPRGAPSYGSDGPYTARQSACLQERPIGKAVTYYMLGSAGKPPSFRDIAYVVGVLHQPVSIDVYADSIWSSYGNGVYNGCTQQSTSSTNHMVSLEGYDCQSSVDKNGNCVFDQNGNLPPGQGLWIVRNSWGTGWGDHGYITSKATNSKGKRCNNIATQGLYFDTNR